MNHIQWAEMKFPPINLWVVAALSQLPQGICDHPRRRHCLASAQRARANARQDLHRKLDTLLALRGGKHAN